LCGRVARHEEYLGVITRWNSTRCSWATIRAYFLVEVYVVLFELFGSSRIEQIRLPR